MKKIIITTVLAVFFIQVSLAQSSFRVVGKNTITVSAKKGQTATFKLSEDAVIGKRIAGFDYMAVVYTSKRGNYLAVVNWKGQLNGEFKLGNEVNVKELVLENDLVLISYSNTFGVANNSWLSIFDRNAKSLGYGNFTGYPIKDLKSKGKVIAIAYSDNSNNGQISVATYNFDMSLRGSYSINPNVASFRRLQMTYSDVKITYEYKDKGVYVGSFDLNMKYLSEEPINGGR